MSNRWFSKSYSEAAGRFSIGCDLLRKNHQVRHERLMLDLNGPEQEPLAIDIAVIGSLESGKVLLSSSGIHGVEGYPGSAIQLSIIDELSKQDSFNPTKEQIQRPGGMGISYGLDKLEIGVSWIAENPLYNIKA